MRLVILGITKTVGKDGVFRDNLDLSNCNLPNNFWALQWNERSDNTGHIEYDSPLIQNDEITQLPSWANNCIAVWQAQLDQEAEELKATESEKQ